MPNSKLLEHSQQTRKDVVQLSPGVWTAVGYAASNVHMIEGRSSVTIIDTTESTAAAQNILAEFRKLCNKPIGRIIYTHSHRDHISGASVFIGEAVPIYASHLFKSDLIAVDAKQIAPNKALGRRTQAQFGIGLSSDERISLGCGPGDRPMQGLGAGFVPPTNFLASDTTLDLDGIQAELIHAPGETEDHLVVWLPEPKVLFCGDNWYHAFPNLYAIRGTPYRDFATWANTLEMLANYQADTLSPGHTRPVVGREAVEEVLLSTRAAILHVMEVTASGMNQGISIDDIAASIELPDNIASKPWLREFYGKISWSVRAYAVGTLGWYDGNPTHLGLMSSKTRATLMTELAGGTDALLAVAKKTDNMQWRLELCDCLISMPEPTASQAAKTLKATTLSALADTEINATARNTYLWEANRLRQELAGDE